MQFGSCCSTCKQKKCDLRKLGRATSPEYTVAEELALSSNKAADYGWYYSRGNTVSLLKPAHFHTVSHTEGEANDEDTLSVCSETIAEDFSQPAPQTDASTSMGFRRNVNKVETDSVRPFTKGA
ncbi:hypothetical protein G5714_004253 [Onychostoma macrolepis]|uniref:Uncharacterized protein n=1 Tax=Onychostoma macrolepis TaxID=369639 RepID=A0A7J6D479_9TELE|nr:hypothetical protein G5714_004253 [Onychostoma macrolepis]